MLRSATFGSGPSAAACIEARVSVRTRTTFAVPPPPLSPHVLSVLVWGLASGAPPLVSRARMEIKTLNHRPDRARRQRLQGLDTRILVDALAQFDIQDLVVQRWGSSPQGQVEQLVQFLATIVSAATSHTVVNSKDQFRW